MNVSGNNPATKSNSTARSRRHRERLRKECTRLDITIGTEVADKAKAIAKRKGVALWEVIEIALEALDVSGNAPGSHE